MNLLKKLILMLVTVTICTFSSEPNLNTITISESTSSLNLGKCVGYELVYEKKDSSTTYFLSPNEVDIVALAKGNKTQQIEAFDTVTNERLKPFDSYDGVSKWFEVLFYMTTTNREEYFEMDSSVRPANFHFMAVFMPVCQPQDLIDQHSEIMLLRQDLTDQLLGIMPLHFVDFKTKRLKDSLSQCSHICKFLTEFEKLMLNKKGNKNFDKEKKALRQKYRNDILKEIACDKIKYKELVLLAELIEAREVVKINMERLEKEKIEKEKMTNNIESGSC